MKLSKPTRHTIGAAIFLLLIGLSINSFSGNATTVISASQSTPSL